MSERPDRWMPLYVGEYLADTMRLTTLQHGAYLLLIMAYWRSGEPLPDDDEDLAAITKLPLKDWQRMRAKIAAFFMVGDGVWRHKRVNKELDKAEGKTVQQSEAGKASAAARKARRNATASANEKPTTVETPDATDVDTGEVTGTPTEGQPEGNPLPIPQPREDSVASATGAAAPPADPPSDRDLVWGDGLAWLASATGKAANGLRSAVGRWCSVYGDAHVLAALTEARSQSPPIVDPVAWIEATLKTRNRTNGNDRRKSAEQPIGNGFIALAFGRS